MRNSQPKQQLTMASQDADKTLFTPITQSKALKRLAFTPRQAMVQNQSLIQSSTLFFIYDINPAICSTWCTMQTTHSKSSLGLLI